ncbi:hypothetical protein GCM10027161_60050 [Microbispora hainanensis]
MVQATEQESNGIRVVVVPSPPESEKETPREGLGTPASVPPGHTSVLFSTEAWKKARTAQRREGHG